MLAATKHIFTAFDLLLPGWRGAWSAPDFILRGWWRQEQHPVSPFKMHVSHVFCCCSGQGMLYQCVT